MGKARRKEKDVACDEKVYLQDEFLQCLAVEMELGELVNLPNGVLLQEWIASHTIAFFEHINLIYGTISEFCTMSGCAEMCAPGNKIYLWVDERGKRSKVPAPQYIDYVMTYMQKTLNDESIFPTKQDKDFPTSFDVYARKIHRLLFHVLAHIYHMHMNEIIMLDLHKHLNCIYAHLILFNQQFHLIDSKELDALNDLSIALKLVPDNQSDTQEPMQTSSTPEPPSLPTSLNLTGSLEQYLDGKELHTSGEQHNQTDLQTGNTFNQTPQHETTQRKKHSRQHSYTEPRQTISSPTNYIKRFISSLSPNNQTNSSSNQSCAINEDHLSNSIGNAIHCKVAIQNSNDLEQSDLLNSDQENQHDQPIKVQNQKIVLSNNLNKRNSQDVDKQSEFSSSLNSKNHKYQHSTPIFFGSSFFSSRTTSLASKSNESSDRSDETDVQSRVNVIKENTKLLNSGQTDGARRTTSASAIYLSQSNTIFSVNHVMSDLNEENPDSLDDQTAMSCNQTQLNDSNSDVHMDTSSNQRNHTDEEETDSKAFASNRTFGNLEIDHLNESDEFDNSDNPTRSDRRVCALLDSN